MNLSVEDLEICYYTHILWYCILMLPFPSLHSGLECEDQSTPHLLPHPQQAAQGLPGKRQSVPTGWAY